MEQLAFPQYNGYALPAKKMTTLSKDAANSSSPSTTASALEEGQCSNFTLMVSTSFK